MWAEFPYLPFGNAYRGPYLPKKGNKAVCLSEAYSGALAHLKTPLLLARSELASLPPNCAPGCEALELAKRRIAGLIISK